MSDPVMIFGLGVIACVGLFTIAAEVRALRLQLALIAKEQASTNTGAKP